MVSKRLSFAFAFYGILLLGSAGFCFWVNSWENTVMLAVAGVAAMAWAHFFNRRHYWGFTALMAQLFLNAAFLGWKVITYFRIGAAGAPTRDLTKTGFILFGLLFTLTMAYLLLAARHAARVKQELL